MSKQHRGLAVANRSYNGQSNGKQTKIQRWLMQEGWKIGEDQHPQASWLLTATDGMGRPILIVQPLQPADRIDIQASVGVSAEHLEGLKALKEMEVQEFLISIRHNLLLLGVDSVEIGETPYLPQQIVLSQRIFDDGLSKDIFLQRVHQVMRALATVQMAFVGKFTQPPPEPNKVGFYVN
jgi:hypothetical protein